MPCMRYVYRQYRLSTKMTDSVMDGSPYMLLLVLYIAIVLYML